MNRSEITYSIAKEFTTTPGPRYKSQGDHSGEHFRESVLLSLLNDCIENQKTLVIILDYTEGFAPSFLEESFGGAARIIGKDKVKRALKLISEEEPDLIEEVWDYIDNVE